MKRRIFGIGYVRSSRWEGAGIAVLDRLRRGEKKGLTDLWVEIYCSLFDEIYYKSMRHFMSITKALADENRVRLLMVLKDQELCVCQLVEFLGLAVSTVSKHLSILHQSGLVNSRKQGRWIYYSLPGKEADPTIRLALGWIHKSLQNNSRIQADIQRMAEVLKLDPSELCKRQCQK